MAVHQFARLCSKQTRLHEIAVKHLAQYILLFTTDKGIMMTSILDFQFHMYVDADFAAMWHQKHSAFRESFLSERDISFPTVVVLFNRELLQLRRLPQEINNMDMLLFPYQNITISHKLIILKIFQYLKTMPHVLFWAHSEGTKVGTQHIALKWSHFKNKIQNGYLKVVKVDTHFNWADIFTKP